MVPPPCLRGRAPTRLDGCSHSIGSSRLYLSRSSPGQCDNEFGKRPRFSLDFDRSAMLLYNNVVDLAGAVVAARGDVADDIFKPRSGNAEPFGQEAQFAKRPVRIDEVKVLVENSNAARQEVEGRALDAGWISKVKCQWIEGHGLAPAGCEARALHRGPRRLDLNQP